MPIFQESVFLVTTIRMNAIKQINTVLKYAQRNEKRMERIAIAPIIIAIIISVSRCKRMFFWPGTFASEVVLVSFT